MEQLSYKLAKQLKDAGFPLKKSKNQRTQPEEGSYVIDHIQYKIPTLSELIEACGKVFDDLDREKIKGRIIWIASATLTIRDTCPTCGSWEYKEEVGSGKTPEEAVAKLWFKLNE